MSDLKFCPQCGAGLVPGDRFCGDCGFDTQSPATPAAGPQAPENKPVQAPPPAAVNKPPPAAQQPPAIQQPAGGRFAPGGPAQPLGTRSGGNKNALMIMIALLAVLFLGGGGLYWWFTRGEDPGKAATVPSATRNNGAATTGGQAADPAPAPIADLSLAATYLSEPGLKCTFFVNYPDGMSGVVERTSTRVVPNETVRVSEVETGVEQGEAFGYGFHYVERADGTYYILDQTPDEIFPVLKNNLTVGQTWSYQDEFGKITWTVVDMGVDLDLGFASFEDCLLVQEDNQAVGFRSVTYYAPGKGIVLVIDPGGATEYYRLTALETVDPGRAAATIIKWLPNYKVIKDDRTQKY